MANLDFASVRPCVLRDPTAIWAAKCLAECGLNLESLVTDMMSISPQAQVH